MLPQVYSVALIQRAKVIELINDPRTLEEAADFARAFNRLERGRDFKAMILDRATAIELSRNLDQLGGFLLDVDTGGT